jgi:hypothetical protein
MATGLKMTDDLVGRLRDRAEYAKSFGWDNVVFGQAADRIEELERHVELRDCFLVENDLWEKFAKGAESKK